MTAIFAPRSLPTKAVHFPSNITEGLQGLNLQALRDEQQFLRLLVYPTNELSLRWTYGVTTVVAVLFTVLGCCLMVHRARQQPIWLFRLTRRRQGTFIVPNALHAFLLFAWIWGVLWIAYSIFSQFALNGKNLSLAPHFAAFYMMVWYPLYPAVLYAATGCFFAAPDSQDLHTEKLWMIHRLFNHPLLMNAISTALPVLVFSSVLPFAILTNVNIRHAIGLWEPFEQAANETTQLTSASAQDFLNHGLQIWGAVARAKWSERLGWIIFTVHIFSILLFHLPAAACMLRLVKLQEIFAREVVEGMVQQRRQDSIKAVQRGDTVRIGSHHAMRKDVNLSFTSSGAPTSPAAHELKAEPTSSLDQVQVSSPSDGALEKPKSMDTPQHQPTTLSHKTTTLSHKTSRADYQLPSDATLLVRARYLQRCFRSLLLLSASVAFVIALGGGLTLSKGIRMYQAAFEGPEALRAFEGGIKIASAVIICAGVLAALAAVFFRFFDTPDFHKAEATKRASGLPGDAASRRAAYSSRNPTIDGAGDAEDLLTQDTYTSSTLLSPGTDVEKANSA
ncbi:unnamed protein product [Jaminaea pallidilutea]